MKYDLVTFMTSRQHFGLCRMILILGIALISEMHCQGTEKNSKFMHLEDNLKRSVTFFTKEGHHPVGSGVTLNSDGYESKILTCLHVVLSGKPLVATFDKKRFFDFKILSKEPKVDLALVSIQGGVSLPDLEVRDSDPQVGEGVYTIGAPYGLHNSLLEGIVSHEDRREMIPGSYKVPYFQVQNLSFPGVSGAPVYDGNGQLMGVVQATFGVDPGNGIGIVLPSAFIQVFLQENRK